MTDKLTDIEARTLTLDVGGNDGTVIDVQVAGSSVFAVSAGGTITQAGSGADLTVADDVTVTGDLAVTGTAAVTGTTKLGVQSEAVDIKGIYLSSTVSVAVPTIAADKNDGVVVDVSAAFTMQPAVGDAVIAIPSEALPTNALLEGAYVTATDTVTCSFGTLEGGAVTGASKNFKFLVIDLTDDQD